MPSKNTVLRVYTIKAPLLASNRSSNNKKKHQENSNLPQGKKHLSYLISLWLEFCLLILRPVSNPQPIFYHFYITGQKHFLT